MQPIQAVREYVGMRVSWSAIVAGAIVMLATAMLLFALALGIIAAATNADDGAIQRGEVWLWICAMIAVLIGSVVGGVVVGVLRGRAEGRTREEYTGASHGLLAWGLAFVLAFGFQLIGMRDLARTATAPIHEVGTFTAAPTVTPRLLRPPTAGETVQTVQTPTIYDRSRDALRRAAGIGWSSFFVWVAAGLLMGGIAEMFGRGLVGRGPLGRMETGRGDEPSLEGERRRSEPMIPSPGR